MDERSHLKNKEEEKQRRAKQAQTERLTLWRFWRQTHEDLSMTVFHLGTLLLYQMISKYKSMGKIYLAYIQHHSDLSWGNLSQFGCLQWGHGSSTLLSGQGARERCASVTSAQQGFPRWRWKQKHSCAVVKGLAFGLISSIIFMNGLGTIIGMHRNAFIKLFWWEFGILPVQQRIKLSYIRKWTVRIKEV